MRVNTLIAIRLERKVHRCTPALSPRLRRASSTTAGARFRRSSADHPWNYRLGNGFTGRPGRVEDGKEMAMRSAILLATALALSASVVHAQDETATVTMTMTAGNIGKSVAATVTITMAGTGASVKQVAVHASSCAAEIPGSASPATEGSRCGTA